MIALACQRAESDCDALLVLVDYRKVDAQLVNTLRHIVDESEKGLRDTQLSEFEDALRDTATTLPDETFEEDCLRAFDEAFGNRRPKHVVVCILIPPDWEKAVYPALFLSGWDFTYLVCAHACLA